MTQHDYTVRLDAFEGPLDLLLFLIRRAEVEVADIPIARITEQYLQHLEQFTAAPAASPGARPRAIDVERAGEFLVMAATLMEIKSRMLTPARPADSDDGASDTTGDGQDRPERADPRAELVRQLLEYKRFRDASDRLVTYRDEYFARYPSAAAPMIDAPIVEPKPDDPAAHESALIDIEDTTLIDLVEAFSRIMQTVDFSRVGEHRVVFDDTPIEIHAEDILLRLRSIEPPHPGGAATAPQREMNFADVFRGRSRSEAIGLFLAVLELCKQQRIRVRQDDPADPAGRFMLELIEPAADAPAAQAPQHAV